MHKNTRASAAAVLLFCSSLLAIISSVPQAYGEELARVNGVPILAAQLEWEVKKFLKDGDVDPQYGRVVRAQCLELLVQRQLVVQSLQKSKLAAKPNDVEQELKRLAKRLERVEKTLDDHLQQIGTDLPTLRGDLLWQLSWKKALDKYMTAENKAKFFKEERQHFDGTQRRIAHILLKRTPERTNGVLQKELVDLKRRLDAGELSFVDAAQQFSAAPTADKGGDMGWIGRRDPMPDSFSRAVFDQKVGEVGSPIVSAFGVHLVRVLEEKTGSKTEKEAAAEISEEMRRFLFEWMVERARSDANIEYDPK